MELLSKKFATATDEITSVGLSNFATHDSNGNQESNPVFPWTLRFEPNRPVVTNNIKANFLVQI